MAKTPALVSAVCILALTLALVNCEDDAQKPKKVKHDKFAIVGQIYCDPCRVQFQTELSEAIEGATVKLECKNTDTKEVTYSVEAKTNKDGKYRLDVDGDHESDTCEVQALESSKADCSEAMDEVAESRIEITHNDGMPSAVRFANPIGFMTKKIDKRCLSMLRDIYKDM